MSQCTCDEASKVEDDLRQALNNRIGDFHLEIREEGVILRGKASSYYGKQLAQHLTMEAMDLPILANEIEVEPCCHSASAQFLVTE